MYVLKVEEELQNEIYIYKEEAILTNLGNLLCMAKYIFEDPANV